MYAQPKRCLNNQNRVTRKPQSVLDKTWNRCTDDFALLPSRHCTTLSYTAVFPGRQLVFYWQAMQAVYRKLKGIPYHTRNADRCCQLYACTTSGPECASAASNDNGTALLDLTRQPSVTDTQPRVAVTADGSKQATWTIRRFASSTADRPYAHAVLGSCCATIISSHFSLVSGRLRRLWDTMCRDNFNESEMKKKINKRVSKADVSR